MPSWKGGVASLPRVRIPISAPNLKGNFMEIRFASNKELNDVVKLNKMFAKENCCNGIINDDYQYYKDKEVAICVVENKIVGYCYGTIEEESSNRSYCEKGEKSYYIEEMYVEKLYRNKGIGKELFSYVENFYKDKGCSLIKLNAVSKDYKKLLELYIEELGMDFISAYLVKRV